MSNSPHSTRPVGPVLRDELLEEVLLHIAPLYSILHILLKDCECVCRTSENCKSLVLQVKCNIEIFLSPAAFKELTCHNRVRTYRLEKYLNIQDCLEKSLKIKFALKST